MPSAFPTVTFSDPARAAANLSLLENRLSPKLREALPTLLAPLPGPDASLNYFERFTAEAPVSVLEFLERHPAALQHLLTIFSYSNFLSETLVQQPRLTEWLHSKGAPGPSLAGPSRSRSLDQIKSRDDLQEEFARFESTSLDLPATLLLARFKRREYLRITLRDVLDLATLGETTLELSQLADVILECALRACERNLHRSYGAPQCISASGRLATAQLTILSLGKLGGQELNYSSDVDLMFLYTRDGETDGGASGKISNAEYFIRLAQAILKAVTEATREGAVFRVDLRLRPQGAEGDLAVSFPAALDYYRTRARPWELQMLIKARASVGDADASRRFLRELAPLIYPPPASAPTPEQFAAIEAVLYARKEITRQLRRAPQLGAEHAAEWNVKLTPGGIRDIEFLTQCLQRLHGGADTWLAAPATASTLVALQRLHDKGYLSGRDFFRLADAYQFLRTVEHRMQLRDGLQRHALPDSPAALDRLARRCGIEGAAPGEQLQQRIARHFAEVRSIYERVVVRPKSSAEEIPAADDFAPTAPAALFPPHLREQYSAVASAIGAAAVNPRARRGLYRFIESARSDPLTLSALEQHPAWIALAAQLFSLSDHAVDLFCRHPTEISCCDDSARLPSDLLVAPGSLSTEAAMASLRTAYRHAQIRAIVRALTGAAAPLATFHQLTRMAADALSSAFSLAARDVLGAPAPPAVPFAVLALGRLGTDEFDIASDADVVFIISPEAPATEPWRRVAERFVHIVGSHTRDGILFPVDTRLRPRGAEGELVHTSSYFLDYLGTQAQAWEAATYLKAFPVAGNLAFGADLVGKIYSTLIRRWGAAAALEEMARQLAALRVKMEKEGTGPRARTEFKHLPGGFYDIEYILCILYFRASGNFPAAEAPRLDGNTLEQIRRITSLGALTPAQSASLSSAALLFRAVDHAHRLVTGATINRDPEPALADRISELFALWKMPLTQGLSAALPSARRDVRSLYESILANAG